LPSEAGRYVMLGEIICINLQKAKPELIRVGFRDSSWVSFVYISSMSNFNNYNMQFPVGN